MAHMTGFSTATFYEQEVLETSKILYPVISKHSDTPFIADPSKKLPHYVLTKTHCTGYCDNCHHRDCTHTRRTFGLGCRTSVLKRECWDMKTYMTTHSIDKAVHIIRNPLDNIVARMHLGVLNRRIDKSLPESILKTFNNTPAGLLAWCEHVDSLFHSETPIMNLDSPPLSNETLSLLKHVPCHSEWFRYVMVRIL